MARARLSRREVIERCLGLGLLMAGSEAVASSFFLLGEPAPAPRPPTPSNELGPFYKKQAPRVASLIVPGDPGLPLHVAGEIVDTRGERVPGALLEIWHADHKGLYDLDGYRYRAALAAAAASDYGFTTVMPGHYPGRVAQHIHYRVSAPGHRTLITQLYFATDPAFEGNPDKNLGKDPLVKSRELVRPVTLAGDPGATRAEVRFDLCLERV
jgi:protocatechuate 3,4-dioxygenase beta subunit